jgi:hypothetical protein
MKTDVQGFVQQDNREVDLDPTRQACTQALAQHERK